MKLWIDLSNSPHAQFFAPVVRELASRGVEVRVTARTFTQTVPLAKALGLDVLTVGKGERVSKLFKPYHISKRAMLLRSWARSESVTAAVSHGSYAQVIAAWTMRLPAITFMDYEYQPANHVSFRLARWVFVPEVFPEERLRHYGASPKRVVRYPGIKEQVYLEDFTPSPGYREMVFRRAEETLGHPLDRASSLVVFRPPAFFALYHPRANEVYFELWRRLVAREGTLTVFLPRTNRDRETVLALGGSNVYIPAESLDGRELIAAADLVVSGGGTMNREAAALGTPAYSIFAGRVGAVDAWLESKGRLHFIRTVEDLDRLDFNLEKRARLQGPVPMRAWIIDRVLGLLDESG